MFNESTTRRRHHNPNSSSSSSNNSATKQVTTATQKFATQLQNIMMGNASDEPTMSWVIVCAILYVLSGVTQVSSFYMLCINSKTVGWYKSAHLMRLSHSLL